MFGFACFCLGCDRCSPSFRAIVKWMEPTMQDGTSSRTRFKSFVIGGLCVTIAVLSLFMVQGFLA